MANELQGERTAVVTANDGVEQVELTELVEALREAGAEVSSWPRRPMRSRRSITWTGLTSSRSTARFFGEGTHEEQARKTEAALRN
jgi:hypothetical protein